MLQRFIWYYTYLLVIQMYHTQENLHLWFTWLFIEVCDRCFRLKKSETGSIKAISLLEHICLGEKREIDRKKGIKS